MMIYKNLVRPASILQFALSSLLALVSVACKDDNTCASSEAQNDANCTPAPATTGTPTVVAGSQPQTTATTTSATGNATTVVLNSDSTVVDSTDDTTTDDTTTGGETTGSEATGGTTTGGTTTGGTTTGGTTTGGTATGGMADVDADDDGIDDPDDCAPNDAMKWLPISGYADTDLDGVGAGPQLSVCSGASLPTGYAATTGDLFPDDATRISTYSGLAYGGGASGDYDYMRDVVVASNGDAYMVGTFSSMMDLNFRSDGTDNKTPTGSADGFVMKVGSDGTYGWTKTFNGGMNTAVQMRAVARDASDNLYICGTFQGTVDFDPGAGTHTSTWNNTYPDAFVLKLDAAGSYQWHVAFGEAAFINCRDILASTAGDVFVAGAFIGTVDFDPGAGTASKTSPDVSYTAAFVLKLSASDGSYQTVYQTGAAGGASFAYALANDGDGNLYIGGTFYGDLFAHYDADPTMGSDPIDANGGSEAFVTKINANGTYAWTRAFGGDNNDPSSYDAVFSLAVSGTSIYASGQFSGAADFDWGSGTKTLTSTNTATDLYLLKMTTAGGFSNAFSLGGTSADYSLGVIADSHGNALLTGNLKGTIDFDFSSGSDSKTLTPWSWFVMRVNSDFTYGWTKAFTDSNAQQYNYAVAAAMGPGDKLWVVGDLAGSVDFDWSTGTSFVNGTTDGTNDMFFSRF